MWEIMLIPNIGVTSVCNATLEVKYVLLQKCNFILRRNKVHKSIPIEINKKTGRVGYTESDPSIVIFKILHYSDIIIITNYITHNFRFYSEI